MNLDIQESYKCTYMYLGQKNCSALRIEVIKRVTITQNIHFKYPTELSQTVHACNKNKQPSVSAMTINNHSPDTMHACMHTQKR